MIEKKLSAWARENGISYKNAWNSSKAGTLPVQTKTSANGRIFVMVEDNKQEKIQKSFEFATPLLAGKDTMQASSTRRNAAATSVPTDQYYHINNGISPATALNTRRDGSGADGLFPVSEAIRLCQKAYYNFSIFRNTIDAMTEFSVSKMYYQGGSAKGRNFFENLGDELNIYNLQDKFFREYYRSGTVVVHRFETGVKEEDLARLNKAFGSEAKKVQLPAKYIILNPYDIGVQSNIVFGTDCIFYKRLNGYEIHRLRTRETPEEKAYYNSLPPDTQKQIDAGAGAIIVKLDPSKLYAIFYKTQDYESMAVPMGFPVLKDIERKEEMKHIDMAISRTMNNAILLVKMGYESKDGDYIFDPKAASAMQSLFESESVGKTLVADFTTEVSFVIPAIGDFLDPVKYQIINEDIKTGLNYVLTGTDSKFANQFISVQLFVQRLEQAREIFINQFWLPEIKRISRLMGFKNYPIPKFNDIDLKDDVEFTKVATRMAELGLLTPSELFDSIETGRVPTPEESLGHQEEFRLQRDKGLYDPLVGGPYDVQKLAKLTASLAPKPVPGSPTGGGSPKPSSPTGRPTGTKAPQTTKKVSITTGSEEEIQNIEAYSLSKIKDNLILSSKLRSVLSDIFLKSTKLESLNDEQKKIVDEISDVIIANEESSKWIESIEKYIKNPVNSNIERIQEIESIACHHGIDHNLAAILINSKK